MNRISALLAVVVLPGLMLACQSQTVSGPAASGSMARRRNTGRAAGTHPGAGLSVRSTAFAAGGAIPARFTCDGENISPPLAWSGVPSSARSLVVLCEDPDAPGGIFTHWVLFDLPPHTTAVPAHLPTTAALRGGARQGTDDFGKVGYSGPCPPGGTHHYHFRVFALNTMLNLPGAPNGSALRKAMEGHVAAEGELVATYARK